MFELYGSLKATVTIVKPHVMSSDICCVTRKKHCKQFDAF